MPRCLNFDLREIESSMAVTVIGRNKSDHTKRCLSKYIHESMNDNFCGLQIDESCGMLELIATCHNSFRLCAEFIWLCI